MVKKDTMTCEYCHPILWWPHGDLFNNAYNIMCIIYVCTSWSIGFCTNLTQVKYGTPFGTTVKVKVKCTLAQAPRLCTGHMAH